MHCSACAMDIDGTLEETEGIVGSRTSYAKSQAEVKFDDDKLNEKKVIERIQNIGYKTEIVSG